MSTDVENNIKLSYRSQHIYAAVKINKTTCYYVVINASRDKSKL